MPLLTTASSSCNSFCHANPGSPSVSSSSSDHFSSPATDKNDTFRVGSSRSGDQNRSTSSSESGYSFTGNDSGSPFVVDDDTVNEEHPCSKLALRSALQSIRRPMKPVHRLRGRHKRLHKPLRERPNVEELADSDSPSSLLHSSSAEERRHTSQLRVSSDDERDDNIKDLRKEVCELQHPISMGSPSLSPFPSRPPTPDVGIDADEDSCEPLSVSADLEPESKRKISLVRSPTVLSPPSSPPRKRPRRRAAPITFVDAFANAASISSTDSQAHIVALEHKLDLSDADGVFMNHNKAEFEPQAILSEENDPPHICGDRNNGEDGLNLAESMSVSEELARVNSGTNYRRCEVPLQTGSWRALQKETGQTGLQEGSLNTDTEYLPLQLPLDSSVSLVNRPGQDNPARNENNFEFEIGLASGGTSRHAREHGHFGGEGLHFDCNEDATFTCGTSNIGNVQNLEYSDVDNRPHSDLQSVLIGDSSRYGANRSRARRRAARLTSALDSEHTRSENGANSEVISLLDNIGSKSDHGDDANEDDEWDDIVSSWKVEIMRDVETFARVCEDRLEEVRYDCSSSMGSRARHVLQYVARTLGVRACISTAGNCTISLVKPHGYLVKISPDAACGVAERAVERAFLACSRTNQQNLTQGSVSTVDFGAVINVDSCSSKDGDSDFENGDCDGPRIGSVAEEPDTRDRLDEWGETIDEEVREFLRKCGQHAQVDVVEHRFHIWGGMSALPVVNRLAQVLGCEVDRGGTAARPEFILRKPANAPLRMNAFHASRVINDSVVALRRLRNGHSVVDVDREDSGEVRSHHIDATISQHE